MAALPSFVIYMFLVALPLSSQGFELTMVRTPGQSICGKLLCWNNATIDGSIFTTTGISIYDVTKPDNRTKIANISTVGAGLFIDPTRSDEIAGTGSLSRYHADISLTFIKNLDCSYGRFECQIQFVNLAGIFETANQTTAPDNGVCDCALLASQLSQLGTKFNDLEKALIGLIRNQTILETEIATLKRQNEILEDKYKNLTSGVSDNQNVQTSNSPSALPVVTSTLSSQLAGSCSRGPPHSPREKFLLWGKVETLCDIGTDSGGWIIIQRRTTGDTDFYKNWDSYKKGFGTTDTDFWIGNDVIHNLTSEGYNELRIDMELNGKKYFAHYSIFNVDNEQLNYKLSISGYEGSAGNSLGYHNGRQFSTYDRDHDTDSRNCALLHTSGWWYSSCYYANLNGVWGNSTSGEVVWMEIADHKSLTFTEMKVRRVN